MGKFEQHRIVVKTSTRCVPVCLKCKLSSVSFEAMTIFSSETWTLRKALEKRLESAQRAMGGVMMAVPGQDNKMK